MANEQWLKDYAQNIYDNKVGYSFEKVLRLFPKYYTRIVGYYMDIVMEEQQQKIRNITIVGYAALSLFKQAQQQWNQIVEEDKKLREETDLTGFDVKILAQWQRQIDFSNVVIKASEQVRLYGEGILDNQVIEAADKTIIEHQKIIENAQTAINFSKQLRSLLNGRE